MPVVSIPDKEMTIRFPDDMPPDEIERQIYTQVYDQPVISQEEAPGVIDKAQRFVSDLFRDKDPGLGPLTKTDREAFEPPGAEVRGQRSEVRAQGIDPEFEKDWYGARELDDDAPGDPDPDKTFSQYASYVPYLAVKALHGVTGPFLPAFKTLGADTEGALNVATEYWRKQIGDSIAIPNVGIGFDDDGGLRIEPREPIPFAGLLGQTVEVTGAVAGPVKFAAKAGGLVVEKLSRYARPFYRSIARGMITGALLGEGDKDKTLENMALFGTFEPLAYGLGKLSEVPKKIKDSTPWRKMTIKERGLVLQSLDDTIKNNPQISEGQILKKWNNPTWRKEALVRRMDTLPREVGVKTAPVIDKAAQQAATSPRSAAPAPTEAQIKAGNYQKGHIKLHGFDISIENPRGSTRSGTDPGGKKWFVTMKDHYGYIKETVGKDKEHLDVFIGKDPESDMVFVVDQVYPKTGKFDEHKVLMGYKTTEEAKAGYLANYEEGWQGIGSIAGMKLESFKAWTKEGDTTKAIGIKKKIEPAKAEVAKTPKDKEYFINTRGKGIKKVAGRPISIEGLDKYDLFYHKDAGDFTITEATTGQRIASNTTLKGAKEKALKVLTDNKDKIDEIIKKAPKIKDIKSVTQKAFYDIKEPMTPKKGPGKIPTLKKPLKPEGGPKIVYDDLPDLVDGYFNDKTNTIYVSKKLSPELAKKIIRHEKKHIEQAQAGALPTSKFVHPAESIKHFMEYFSDPHEVSARAAETGEEIPEIWNEVFKLREKAMRGETNIEPISVEKISEPFEQEKIKPDGHVDGTLSSWHNRRLTGTLRSNDPKPIKKKVRQIRIYLKNKGNGIVAEDMLNDAGIKAFSSAPYSVDVVLSRRNLVKISDLFGIKITPQLPEPSSAPKEGAQPSPVKPEKPKTPSLYADVGGYATQVNSVLKMPEIVQLAKGLAEGRYPAVKKNLRKHAAAGVFYPAGGRIELRADIFKDPDQAAAVLAHEIGHMVDWLPEKDIKRGNILGRIASLKRYMKHTIPRSPDAPGELTEKDRRRLRYLAKKLTEADMADKWIDEIIKKELPITPNDVLAIWNTVEGAKLIHPDLYDYVAGLNAPEKKSIVKEALAGQVPEQIKRFAKIVKEKTGKKIQVPIYEETIDPKTGKKKKVPTVEFKTAIHKKYVDLINKEIKKRKLFHKGEVMDELKALTKEWKPFNPAADPKYTSYRYSGVELYADAFSALINAPGLLKAKAPLFYEGFFNYLERKPKVKELYNQIQDDIKSGAVQKKRVENLREMFRKGDDAYADSLKTDRNFKDGIAREFIDANWMILKKIKNIGERNIPAGENPRYKLEEMAYSGSEAELYLTTVFRNVLKPLEDQNLTWDDFGEYLYHQRVSTERAELANPQGWTPDLSKERITEINKDLSPEQVKTLEASVKAYRDLRSSNVIAKVEKAELYNDELMKKLKDNENYAAFDVIKYIEKKYGRGPGAKIYRQVGTLQEISNPATATVMKDISLIKATNKQMAGKSVVKFLQKHFADEIRPADKRWNGKFQEIKDPGQGSKDGLIVYLENGKARGYYVDKYIAESFERNPVESMLIARILSTTIQPFRLAFTELNYGFWMFNIHRDFFRAAMVLPKAKISTFLPYYLQGIKPAFRSVYGIPDKVVAQMQKDNMLISIADVRGLRPEDQQIERLLRMYHLKPAKWDNMIIRPIGKMFTYFTNIGRGLERTTKVASYKYLKDKFPDMTDAELGHLVRVRGGSPDFLRLGRGYPIYNNILMFSNAMKEGYRGDYEAFAESPGEFMWKKVKYVYIPKLLMYAGSIGLLGAGVKAIFDGMSEYDKTNYICIPLGVTETGKSVYYRLPIDETSRFMGGIFWKMLDRDTKKMTTGLFDYMAGQAPTIHPGVDILIACVQYTSGLNPYDHFRGRYAIPEQVFEAGGKRSHEAFAKWLANKSGATLVYKFRSDDVDAIKSELESVVGYPFASNIVGRFLRVSNQGIRETLRETKFEIRSANTREILDAKDALTKWTRGEILDDEDITAILKKPDIIDRNMMVNLARKYGMVYLEEFMSATSTEEKAAVLNKLWEKIGTTKKSGKYDDGLKLDY